MSNALEEARDLAILRQRAAEKLGLSKSTAGKPAGRIEALAVLHQLASSPTTAGDAMALLHELQVHQVELELQQEELLRSQSELEAALRRQAALVERAPVAYMTVDARTLLCEINLVGERLLGAAREDLLGRPLAGLLASGSVSTLQALLDRTHARSEPQTCELELMPVAGMDRTVLAVADLDTTGGRFLLVLMTQAVTLPPQTEK